MSGDDQCLLHEAIRTKDLLDIAQLIEKSESVDLETRDKNGHTAL